MNTPHKQPSRKWEAAIVAGIIIAILLIFILSFSPRGSSSRDTPFFVFFALAYFLPYWIALFKRLDNRYWIMALTLGSIPLDHLVAGEIIWVVCLIWACVGTNSNNQNTPIIIQNTQGAPQISEEIKNLAKLKDEGILTQEEFNHQKAKLLGDK